MHIYIYPDRKLVQVAGILGIPKRTIVKDMMVVMVKKPMN